MGNHRHPVLLYIYYMNLSHHNAKRRYLLILFLMACVYLAPGCKSKPGIGRKTAKINVVVDLSKYQKAQLDSGDYTEVTIIKAFHCDTTKKGSVLYADLYICEKANKDTIYVYDLNKRIPITISDTTKYHQMGLDIIRDNIFKVNKPTRVMVTIPKGYEILKTRKYLAPSNMTVAD